MNRSAHTRCTAFIDDQRLASGELRHVALKARQGAEHGDPHRIRIFDDRDGCRIELNLALSVPELMRQVEGGVSASEPGTDAPAPRAGPGRPKLGVIAREVTLLPRHWQWLNAQPGGASVALRKLVEEARRTHAASDRRRAAQEAAYRFMSALAGDATGFEDATRALFAGDAAAFERHIATWPPDVREHAALLAADALHA